MPITQAQITAAEQAQWQAAQDASAQVRLIAGPGTGKTSAIERRVAHVLNNNANPNRVYVISFTRATCKELEERVLSFCATQPCAPASTNVRVSTMHALALWILRSAAVLATLYPDDPTVLDDWETKNVYDLELATALGCSPGRAAEVRQAHDAQWQTLDPQSIAQAAITQAEIQGFNTFHSTRRNLYCCILPGEVVYECVDRIQHGAIQTDQLPPIDHLIVDEYQDLNACDQEFVWLLANNGATLFIAGDDDQSIYGFRHANPSGIVQFENKYPASATHRLTDCFRCTPAIISAADTLIILNPNRIPKQLHSLYRNSAPPLRGTIFVWSFTSAQQEAAAIAQSCQSLIRGGMAGRENQILILISNRRLQLGMITQELGNLGLPFDAPSGVAIRDEEAIRTAYSILRIVRDRCANAPDYLAHRSLLTQLHGVGANTAKGIGDQCIANNQNFRALFDLPAMPHWLNGRAAAAVSRILNIIQNVNGWTLQDTIGARIGYIANILATIVFNGSSQVAAYLAEWNAFATSLPQGMLLEEVLEYLAARDEADERRILEAVNLRLEEEDAGAGVTTARIRILTMHGAKGLSGSVVFIPAAEQGIMPSFRGIHAVGLLNEQRRLFYVSLTRARAACVISHAALHTGAEAFLLQQSPNVRLSRSQFLNEMRIASTNKYNNNGLTAAETAQIITDINAL